MELAKTPSGANAPYQIVPRGKQFDVFNNAGEKKATFDKRSAAKDYVDALYANVPGATKRATKVPFTGTAKNRVPVKKKAEMARVFTTAERKAAAAKGHAMSGGGFPIKTKTDLKNAVQAFGRAKNKGATKAFIIRRAKALGATDLLPEDWMTTTEKAHAGIACPEENCTRSFLDEAQLNDHAEAVHTFDDIQRAVNDAVREEYRVEGDPQVGINSVWVWVMDLSTDWVVFNLENGAESSLQKCSYTMDAQNQVTLGNPVEVQRRTVYEPVPPEAADTTGGM